MLTPKNAGCIIEMETIAKLLEYRLRTNNIKTNILIKEKQILYNQPLNVPEILSELEKKEDDYYKAVSKYQKASFEKPTEVLIF